MPRWLPNLITLIRIGLIPVFVLLALAALRSTNDSAPELHIWSALTLFAIGASDVLDGYIARRYSLTSRTGAVLDAAADKLAQITVAGFFTFVDPRLPIGYITLLVVRDALLGGGTWWVFRRRPDVTLEHQYHGKISSTLIFALLMLLALDALKEGVLPLLVLSTVAVVLSTFDYVRVGVKALRKGPSGTVG